MKTKEALRPNDNPNEVQKCIGSDSLSWFTKLFNKIIMTKKCWKNDGKVLWIVVPIFKNKGGYSELHLLLWDQGCEPCNET